MLRLHGAISTLGGSRLLKLCNPVHIRTSLLFSTGKSGTSSTAVKGAESSDKAILKSLLAHRKWVVFPNGSSYCGKLSDNGAMHGKGKFVSANGSIYVGTFDNNVFAGPGKVALANGCLLWGTFSNSQLQGYGGVFFTSGKSVYGYFKEGRLCRGEKHATKVGGTLLNSWEKQMQHEPGQLVLLDSHMLQVEASKEGHNEKNSSSQELTGEAGSAAASTAVEVTSEVTKSDLMQSMMETDSVAAPASLFPENNEPVWWKAPENVDRNDFMSAIDEILGHPGKSNTLFNCYKNVKPKQFSVLFCALAEPVEDAAAINIIAEETAVGKLDEVVL